MEQKIYLRNKVHPRNTIYKEHHDLSHYLCVSTSNLSILYHTRFFFTAQHSYHSNFKLLVFLVKIGILRL